MNTIDWKAAGRVISKNTNRVSIFPYTATPNGFAGKLNDTLFFVIVVENIYLKLELTKKNNELVNAFIDLAGYPPVKNHSKNDLIIYEWDKIKPDSVLLKKSVHDEPKEIEKTIEHTFVK